MANWNLPSITDLYTNVLAYIGNRLNDLALMLDSVSTSPTNLPTGAKRWNSTSKKWEVWDGSAWADMAALYAISISGNAATATNSTQLGGVAASGYATAAQGVKADAAQPASTAINTSNIGSQTVAVAGSCTGNAATATSVTIGPSIQGAYKNLYIYATGTTAAIRVQVDEIVVENSSHNYVTLRNLDRSADTGNASGVANSLDTGSWAYSTWYNIFLIWDGTTPALLFSLSATAPLLPTGYTHFARVNAFRTPDPVSGNYYPKAFIKRGGRTQYKVGVTGSNVRSLPIMATGTAGNPSTPTWQALSVSPFVPPTATGIYLSVRRDFTESTRIIVAPNPNYGSWTSATNPPPIIYARTTSYAEKGANTAFILLESTNIYYACDEPSAGTLIACIGWEE